MSIAASVKTQITTVETLEENVADVAAPALSHTGHNTAQTFGAATTPPGTKCSYELCALSEAAKTVDLTDLTGSNGAAIDGSGLRVQAIKIKHLGDNPLTVEEGDTNGYDGFGASFLVILEKDAEITLIPQDAGADISGTNKTLDFSGTGSETFELSLILG